MPIPTRAMVFVDGPTTAHRLRLRLTRERGRAGAQLVSIMWGCAGWRTYARGMPGSPGASS